MLITVVVDPVDLDTWVFDRVDEFLAEASKNETLKGMIHEDKVIFFLHLLGLDTSGHAYRPHSTEYVIVT